MSVLASRRTQSKAEYVNVAYKIYIQTLGFISRLSARYSRLLAPGVERLASDLLEHCEIANSIFPGKEDENRKAERREHLTEARGAVNALDVKLSIVYEILMLNPQGAFNTQTGNPVSASAAKEKLERMAQNLGELIDSERKLITGVLKNDARKK